ncbi:MAG: extracellular solute-binding protein [Lachnospiraceae bacterium]|jgi:putative aldouronate transport system substrate-binding protein|nr:extracellular solute-binding protein [Lachnospiraceae bacterium]
MKKIRWRSWLICLILALNVVWAGCGKKQETVNQEEQSQEEWSWPLPEQKELSMWTAFTNNYIDTPNELKTIQLLEEQTNVHVNWTVVSGNEAAEKFGLMMASGNYPDLIRGVEQYYTGGLVQACQDGIILDLSDVVEQYMPNYQTLRQQSEKVMKDTTTDDGKLVAAYVLASKDGKMMGESVWGGMGLRRDWLEEQNLEVPKTIADWEEVLMVFRDVYHCEAPLMIASKTGYDSFHHFISAYGVLGDFYNDNGTVKYGPLEQGYRQWIELFHKWYIEGLIDPNFINNDASFRLLPEYMATGRAGASATLWGHTANALRTMGYELNEDFWIVGAPSPILKEGDKPQVGRAMSEETKETVAITNSCKDIELAARWLDHWYTVENMRLVSIGIEGESYISNGDGTYSLTEGLKQQAENGTYASIQDALTAQYSMSGYAFGLYNWDMWAPMYEGDPALEAYDAWAEDSYDLMLPKCMTLTEEEQRDFNTKYTAIETLVQEMTIKYITGAEHLDGYDAFVESLKTYGIEDCIAYKQAAFDRYQAR